MCVCERVRSKASEKRTRAKQKEREEEEEIEEEEEGTTVEKLKSFWVCNFRARGTFLLYWFIYFNNE